MNIIFEQVTDDDKLRLLAASEGITKAMQKMYSSIHLAQTLRLNPDDVCDVSETEIREALSFNQCIIDFLRSQN